MKENQFEGVQNNELEKVIKIEKKLKKPEMIPLTEQEVIDVLNAGEFGSDNVDKIWTRFCTQCYREIKAIPTDPNLVDDLYKKKLFDTLQKTKYADPNILNLKGFLPIIGGSKNPKDILERVRENREYIKSQNLEDDPDPFATPPKPSPENLIECGPEIAKWEQMVSRFESEYDLGALLAIEVLSADDAPKHPLRNPAKIDLGFILLALNDLNQKTNITIEKYLELNSKYKELSRAVGLIKDGRVDHTYPR